MSSCPLSVSVLRSGASASSLIAWALQKARGFWTWWWPLYSILSGTTTPLRSLVLVSCYPFEHLTVDFPSHFILSLIDVFQDSASCDKLIFPFAIIRILRYFSVSSPASDPFTFMCAIDATTVKRSEVQFRSRQQDSTRPSRPTPSRFTWPTSALSFSSSDV